MSLVQCGYEEEHGYISINDNYTNNLLKLTGYTELSEDGLVGLCYKQILSNELVIYAQKYARIGYMYSCHVLKGRFELGEPAIAKDSYYSYLYAMEILKGRFELGEPVIASSAEYSYYYATDVIKGRFELGEPAIAKDTHYSYWYTTETLKGRFELGEDAISSDTNIKNKYKQLTGIEL